MNKRNVDNGLSRAEWEYLTPPDNEGQETGQSPEYEALGGLREVCYAYKNGVEFYAKGSLKEPVYFPNGVLCCNSCWLKKQNYK